MNKLMIGLIALGLMLSGGALAAKKTDEEKAADKAAKQAEKAAQKEKKEEPVVSATGKLTQDGEKYFLIETGGKKVPLPPAKKTGSDVNYESLTNCNVKVTGTGTTAKDGAVTKFKTVTAVAKVEAPAPAPAAEAKKEEK